MIEQLSPVFFDRQSVQTALRMALEASQWSHAPGSNNLLDTEDWPRVGRPAEDNDDSNVEYRVPDTGSRYCRYGLTSATSIDEAAP